MNVARVFVGGAQVVASGSVVSAGDEPIEVHPFAPDKPPYKIEFVFADGASNEVGGIRGDQAGPNHFRLTLVNFDNVFGQASVEPLYVANLDGRRVLLRIAGQVIGEKPRHFRVIHYTFFLGGVAGV
jgi:hypothetical protein